MVGEFVNADNVFNEGILNMILNEGAKFTNLAHTPTADVCHHGYANILFND